MVSVRRVRTYRYFKVYGFDRFPGSWYTAQFQNKNTIHIVYTSIVSMVLEFQREPSNRFRIDSLVELVHVLQSTKFHSKISNFEFDHAPPGHAWFTSRKFSLAMQQPHDH